MNSKQCRMARAGLKWSLDELSERSGISKNSLSRFERNEGSRLHTAETIKDCFLATGKVLFEGSNGVYIESAYTLADIQTGPFSPAEEIQRELDFFMTLEKDPSIRKIVKCLEDYLKLAIDSGR